MTFVNRKLEIVDFRGNRRLEDLPSRLAGLRPEALARANLLRA